MPANFINDPAHWRKRATEMVSLAEAVNEPEAAATMLRIASDYMTLAKRAEARAEGVPSPALVSDPEDPEPKPARLPEPE